MTESDGSVTDYVTVCSDVRVGQPLESDSPPREHGSLQFRSAEEFGDRRVVAG